MSSPAPDGRTPAAPSLTSLPQGKHSNPDRSRPFDATELLARLWKANLPLMQERVAFLGIVADLASAGTLAQPDRTQAADIAHKLAGSLGMFGFPKGTELARQLEEMLEADGSPDPTRLLQLSSDLRLALPL